MRDPPEVNAYLQDVASGHGSNVHQFKRPHIAEQRSFGIMLTISPPPSPHFVGAL